MAPPLSLSQTKRADELPLSKQPSLSRSLPMTKRHNSDMTHDDAALLDAYRGGDDEAFSTLVRRYQFLVLNACRRQTATADVDDCVQAVFVVLARRPQSALRAPALAAWLHRVCHFVCRDARRAAKRRGAAMAHVKNIPHTSDPSTVHVAHVVTLLDSALLSLAEKQRAAVLLHAEENSAQEIAQRLGITAANAYKLTERGLEKLRNYLTRRGAVISTTGLVACLGTQTLNAATPVISSAPTLLALSNSTNATILAQGASMQLTFVTVKTVMLTTTLSLIVGASILMAADVVNKPADPPGKDVEVVDEFRVSVDFQDLDIEDTVDFIKRISGITLTVDKSLKNKSVTIKMEDAKISEMLLLIAKLLGGELVKDANGNYSIVSAKETATKEAPKKEETEAPPTKQEIDFSKYSPITLRVEGMNSQFIAGWIGKMTSTTIDVDPTLYNINISVNFNDLDFGSALKQYAEKIDGKLEAVPDKVDHFRIVPNPPPAPSANQ